MNNLDERKLEMDKFKMKVDCYLSAGDCYNLKQHAELCNAICDVFSDEFTIEFNEAFKLIMQQTKGHLHPSEIKTELLKYIKDLK